MKLPFWLGALASLTLGCGGPDGRPGDGTDGGNSNGDGGGSNGDNCSDASKLVYVVDSNNQFSRFDPSTKTFSAIGTLNCPATGDILGPATPFSMAIDRTPTAWVLYSSGELFKVNTQTAACEATSWNAPSNLALFGMGFSTDAVGGSAETLFVAGGSSDPLSSPTSNLSTINTSTLSPFHIGTVTGWPELTGTGSAELWGFFPSASGSRIEKINKANGMPAQAAFPLTGPLVGEPRAWAFAFWGGDFWVFLQKSTDSNTTVYQIDGTNGSVKGMTNASGRSIVGAGVSTCAPTVIL